MIEALRKSDNPSVRQIEWIGSGPRVSVRETRCISATHLGAAAGKGIQPRDLKVSDIQARLRADGVSFDVGDREQKNL
jgi:hypothetical protein